VAWDKGIKRNLIVRFMSVFNVLTLEEALDLSNNRFLVPRPRRNSAPVTSTNLALPMREAR
jgi:hypothetical protein